MSLTGFESAWRASSSQKLIGISFIANWVMNWPWFGFEILWSSRFWFFKNCTHQSWATLPIELSDSNMELPKAGEWQSFTLSNGVVTKIKCVRFSNRLLVFVLQGIERVASWIEAKYSVDVVSGRSDTDTHVAFGDRDDIWGQLIARQLVQHSGGLDVVLGLRLESSCKSPSLVQETCKYSLEILRRSS